MDRLPCLSTSHLGRIWADPWAGQGLRKCIHSGLEMSSPSQRKQMLIITRESEEDNQEAKYPSVPMFTGFLVWICLTSNCCSFGYSINLLPFVLSPKEMGNTCSQFFHVTEDTFEGSLSKVKFFKSIFIFPDYKFFCCSTVDSFRDLHKSPHTK